MQETPAELISKINNQHKNIIAFIKKNVVMEVLAIKDEYCFVEVRNLKQKYRGWILQKAVFGV